MERGGDASASMGERLALRRVWLKHRIARDRAAGVPTGMAPNSTAAPRLFDRALLKQGTDEIPGRLLGTGTSGGEEMARPGTQTLTGMHRHGPFPPAPARDTHERGDAGTEAPAHARGPLAGSRKHSRGRLAHFFGR